MARSTILMPASWSWLSPLSLDGRTGTQQGNAAAGDDAFFNGSTGGVQRVFDAGLLFLHFDFGGSADLDQATPPASLATRSCSFSLS
jgi:hypothetical protein